MKHYRFSNDTQVDDRSVTLKEALALMDDQESMATNMENYIGFTHDDCDATIQFVRKTAVEWIVDVPYYKDGEFVKAVDATIPHRFAIDIVERFFDKDDPLTQALISEEFEKFESIFHSDYKIRLVEVDLETEG